MRGLQRQQSSTKLFRQGPKETLLAAVHPPDPLHGVQKSAPEATLGTHTTVYLWALTFPDAVFTVHRV